MSSGVESDGMIAAAVMLPVGVAFGTAWIAWQAGKLLIEAGRAADRRVAERKRQLEEAAMHRKRSAMANHTQLMDMCMQVIAQIDNSSGTVHITDFAALEQMKAELNQICHAKVPDDVVQIENQNALGFLLLEKIVTKQQGLAKVTMEEASGLYRGLSLADLLDDLRLAISVMTIQATEGKNVVAADPVVLERVKLNEKLSVVTAQIMEALECVTELANTCGLSASDSRWFHSCFNGIDEQIQRLYMPVTTNAEMKKGIKRLEGILEQYDTLMPTIKSERQRFAALYEVYADASRALGEPVEARKSFSGVDALEERLQELQRRSEKAKECTEIYQKLGPTAYVCYAWDQELQAIGYSVHSRKDIAEMAQYKPQNAKLGEAKLPFYHWNDEDLTQLYSMTEECSLQVIVHEDGSVMMQAISDDEHMEGAKSAQTAHCALLKRLHENLRKNWFITYNYQETASPDEVTSVTEWFGSDESAWKPDETEFITEQRRKDKGEAKARQMK